jgi:hypothetical protein
MDSVGDESVSDIFKVTSTVLCPAGIRAPAASPIPLYVITDDM